MNYDDMIRMNKKGHKELVRKQKGKPDEEILNEISDEILEYLEYNGPLQAGGGAGSPDQIEYDRRNNDLIATNGESPNNMEGSTRRDSLSPEMSRALSNYRANARGNKNPNKYISDEEYDGLDYGATHNESFTGTSAIAMAPNIVNYSDDDEDDDEEDNVQEKLSLNNKNHLSENIERNKMRRRTLNEYSPEFKGAGYNPGSASMGRPRGKGVAAKSPSRYNVGEFDTELHDDGAEWPRKHNDTAAMCDVDSDGVEHEPQGVHVSSHGEPSDGHQHPVGHDWPAKPKHSGGIHEPVKSYGTMGESWSPSKIGNLMAEEDMDIQALFDSYAKRSKAVSLPDFKNLMAAHGSPFILDESVFEQLLANNREFLFNEFADQNGKFYVASPLTEAQFRSPEEEAEGAFASTEMMGIEGLDDEDMMGSLDDMSPDYDEFESWDRQHGAGFYGDHGSPYSTCPECGTPGSDEFCPSCDHEMGGEFEFEGDASDWSMSDLDDNIDHGMMSDEEAFEESYRRVTRFLNESKGIIRSRKNVGSRLTESWKRTVGRIDARLLPKKASKALLEMAYHYGDFKPLLETAKMDKMGGKGVADSKAAASPDLSSADSPGPDDMQELGEPLGKSQKNSYKKTPVMTGTAKGMSESMKRNVAKIIEHVTKVVDTKKAKAFSVALEGKGVKSNARKTLAEAAADAEELIQHHGNKAVTINVALANGKRRAISLPGISRRGLLTSEGKAVFRHRSHANAFAKKLVNEGCVCKMTSHSWGYAVHAPISYNKANAIFLS